MFGCPQDHKDIRGDAGLGIALFIVDEQVARDIYIWPVLKVKIQSLHTIRQGLALEVAFCHELAIRTGIFDG